MSNTPASPVFSSGPPVLKATPLKSLHLECGAKMVPFAGYEMPLNYGGGIVAEHLHVRIAAGLFDVSHMGQAVLVGPDHETTARAVEALVPSDVLNLAPGQQRYSQLLDENGGILDDLMVSRPSAAEEAGCIHLVVNASTKEADFAYIAARLPDGVKLLPDDDRALIALQGPESLSILNRLTNGAIDLPFMMTGRLDIAGIPCHLSRSGYTGEDGFEISVKADEAPDLWRALLSAPAVKPIGLGARDTLRLEAGLCLYGQDINSSRSPVEAGLAWSIPKRRREEGGFHGFERIRSELASGSKQVRCGLKLGGRSAARSGMTIFHEGQPVGNITSGAFTPTAVASIAMGYVPPALVAPGTALTVEIRGTPVPARVVPLPFVPHRYVRTRQSV